MDSKEMIAGMISDTIRNSNKKGSNDILCKINLARNYREIGFWDTKANRTLPDIKIDFFEGRKIQKVYADLLNTSERFNRIEIHFNKEMVYSVSFIWDQAYYDKYFDGA